MQMQCLCLQNNYCDIPFSPGPGQIKILHRFSDNCAQIYECAAAFTHISQLQEIIYHYTVAGHSKGPSDGLGAVIKKIIERMLLGGKVINTGYQAYLALAQNQLENSNQKLLYVLQRKVRNEVPKKSQMLKL